jgi:hypothetical protein
MDALTKKLLQKNQDYHASNAIGSSILKKIASKSLAHALTQEFNQTDAMILGSAIHAAILEPETFKEEFVFSPKFDRRTKVGKEAAALFEEQAQGKTILTEDKKEIINGVIKSLNSHRVAKGMLSGGEAEYSYYHVDEETGLTLKCRPDYANHGALIDLKTCQDASHDGFMRACFNLGYHIQAAFYLDVYNKANGTNLNEFFFLAVETSSPYAINTFKMGDVEISLGRQQYRKALNQLAGFKKNGERLEDLLAPQFGYGESIKSLEFPVWMLQKIEDNA